MACRKGDAGVEAKVSDSIQGAIASLAENIPEVQNVAEQRA
jgi:type I restriction enzyme R subunit